MTIAAPTDRTIMRAENRVHKLFLRFVETISEAERTDFFDPRNADLWQAEFARWMERQIDRDRPSND